MPEVLEWNSFITTISTALGIEEEEIKKETHLYDDIGIDSLGILSLGMKLIKVYNIKLPLSVVATIQTVEDLYSAMDKHRTVKT